MPIKYCNENPAKLIYCKTTIFFISVRKRANFNFSHCEFYPSILWKDKISPTGKKCE